MNNALTYGTLQYFRSRRVTHYCVVEDFSLSKTSLCMWYKRNIYSHFSGNSEAFAYVLLGNFEKCFLVFGSIVSR